MSAADFHVADARSAHLNWATLPLQVASAIPSPATAQQTAAAMAFAMSQHPRASATLATQERAVPSVLASATPMLQLSTEAQMLQLATPQISAAVRVL